MFYIQGVCCDNYLKKTVSDKDEFWIGNEYFTISHMDVVLLYVGLYLYKLKYMTYD